MGKRRTCQEPCAGTGLHPRVLRGGGRSCGAVWGCPCTPGISSRSQVSLLGAARAQHQHQPRAGSRHVPRTVTLPAPTLQPTQQQISAAIRSQQPFRPFPGCAPQATLTNPNSALSSFSLTQPLASGPLCLGAEQFAASNCKIPCANANGVNLPPHKQEDAWDGAEEPAKVQPHGHEW